MLYAAIGDTRQRAEPKLEAVCPLCQVRVIPKCGEIVSWHWAHESVQECDTWAEGESEWHLGWKALVRPEACEVVRGPHRADIVLTDGTVLELQHSPISPAVIRERELFYRRMLWLVDATDWAEHLDLRAGKNATNKPYVTFRWRHPRRTWFESRRRLFLDLGPDLLELKRVYHDGPVGGWGHRWTRDQFIAEILGPAALLPPAGLVPATESGESEWSVAERLDAVVIIDPSWRAACCGCACVVCRDGHLSALMEDRRHTHICAQDAHDQGLCRRCRMEPHWPGYQWGTACFKRADVEFYARRVTSDPRFVPGGLLTP